MFINSGHVDIRLLVDLIVSLRHMTKWNDSSGHRFGDPLVSDRTKLGLLSGRSLSVPLSGRPWYYVLSDYITKARGAPDMEATRIRAGHCPVGHVTDG